MSDFESRGLLFLPELANRQEINQQTNSTNQMILYQLLMLADRVISDCYQLQPSKDIIRNFIVSLETLRGDL